MGQAVEVVASELTSASVGLADAGQRLQDGLSTVDLAVGQLLGSGWKGAAASAFGAEWDKWHSGAGQVVRGLQTMSDLLRIAGREYAKTDEQAAGALSSSVRGGSGGSGTGASGGGAAAGSAGAAAGGRGVAELVQQMNLTGAVTAGPTGTDAAPSAAPAAQLGQALPTAALAQEIVELAQRGGDEAGAAQPEEGQEL